MYEEEHNFKRKKARKTCMITNLSLSIELEEKLCFLVVLIEQIFKLQSSSSKREHNMLHTVRSLF